MKILTLCLTLVSLALAASRTKAPPGALTVGKRQKYTTISQAVAALSNTTTSEQVIFIQPGTYSEQVYIPKLSGPLTVFGYTKDDSKYAANQVTIVASESQKSQPNNDLTATLRVWTSDFKLYNVNVKNAFGEGSQAVAVSAQADVSSFLHPAATLSFLSLSLSLYCPSFHQASQLTLLFSSPETSLLRLRPHRLPRHPPRQRRPPALRQNLHRRRHRLHLRPARPRLVREVRLWSRAPPAGLQFSQRNNPRARLDHRFGPLDGRRRLVCHQQVESGFGGGVQERRRESGRWGVLPGPALEEFREGCFPADGVGEGCQRGRVGYLERGG